MIKFVRQYNFSEMDVYTPNESGVETHAIDARLIFEKNHRYRSVGGYWRGDGSGWAPIRCLHECDREVVGYCIDSQFMLPRGAEQYLDKAGFTSDEIVAFFKQLPDATSLISRHLFFIE